MSASRYLLILFLSLGISLPVWAQSEEEARQQLDALRQRLAELEQALQQDRSAQAKLRRTLRADEIKLGEINRDISATQATLANQEQELASLAGEQQTLNEASNRQQARVAREMRHAYQMGREGGLKALLNQENVEALARVMAYYRYIYQARSEAIEQYRQTLSRLEQVVADTERVKADLERSRAALEAQREALQLTRARRQRTLVALNASISSKDQQRKSLEYDRQELEALLKTIEEAILALAVPDDYKPFAEVKGKMPWPLKGKHSRRFGQSRNSGKMRWQGVTIPAPEGMPVKPIHYGRVVFADWFRGSGLLVIVDHGDGYMSLYAHNQSLQAQVGEWVTPDTPISTVGNSGGQDESALYFEVRHQGTPVNPAKWCKKR